MRELELQEYQTTRGVPLSGPEIDALREIARVDITPTSGAIGCFDVTPTSFVGGLAVGELRVVIRPKLPVENVLFLLTHSIDRMGWKGDDPALAEDPALVEAVVGGFVAQTRRALRRGVLQGYRQVEESATTVRGRIRFDDQIRDRYGLYPPIEVRFDDFTEDIELNRVLKAAIGRLLRMRLRSDTSRASLRALDGALSRVRRTEYDPRALPEFVFSRLDAHYRPAVELAKVVLRGAALDLRHGGKRSSGFVVDMNQVFEDFVVQSLRDALGLSQAAFPQNGKGHTLCLDEGGRLRLKPDLSWWRGGRCVFVGDVKYKLDAGGGSAGDLYQLHAYCTATGLRHGMLVYASGGSEPVLHRVRQTGLALEVVVLDLTQEPDGILTQVARLARHIREVCSAR